MSQSNHQVLLIYVSVLFVFLLGCSDSHTLRVQTISHLPTPNRSLCFLLCLLQFILHTAKKLNCLDSPNKHPFPLHPNLNTRVHDLISFTFQGHSPFLQPMLPIQAKSSFSCSCAKLFPPHAFLSLRHMLLLASPISSVTDICYVCLPSIFPLASS